MGTAESLKHGFGSHWISSPRRRAAMSTAFGPSPNASSINDTNSLLVFDMRSLHSLGGKLHGRSGNWSSRVAEKVPRVALDFDRAPALPLAEGAEHVGVKGLEGVASLLGCLAQGEICDRELVDP